MLERARFHSAVALLTALSISPHASGLLGKGALALDRSAVVGTGGYASKFDAVSGLSAGPVAGRACYPTDVRTLLPFPYHLAYSSLQSPRQTVACQLIQAP